MGPEKNDRAEGKTSELSKSRRQIEPFPGDLGLLRVMGWPYPFAIGLTRKYLALRSLASIRTAMTASRRLKGTSSSSESCACEVRRVHGGLIWPPLRSRDLFSSKKMITSFRMQRRHVGATRRLLLLHAQAST